MHSPYPPVGFHFRVNFPSLSSEVGDTHFQSVSGLNVEIETEDFKEGGENRFVHHLPKSTKYGPIQLKRGMAHSSELINWCFNAFEHFEFQPLDLVISLLNEKQEPLKSWNVKHAIPVKWSISDFNAEENAIVIESLELKIHYFKLI